MKYVAFLRGIGLGKRRPQGAQLASIFETIGHADVATFIASGNVVFDAKGRDSSALEKSASEALEKELGYQVDVFVRTARDVVAIAASTPFPDEDPSAINLHVAFLSAKPSPEATKALIAVRSAYDRFSVMGRELYWLCRGPLSASKVWERPDVKSIRLPNSTMRNITTLKRLTAKYLVLPSAPKGA